MVAPPGGAKNDTAPGSGAMLGENQPAAPNEGSLPFDAVAGVIGVLLSSHTGLCYNRLASSRRGYMFMQQEIE
jgi:hypothetical protein